jgi:hypothetical protein
MRLTIVAQWTMLVSTVSMQVLVSEYDAEFYVVFVLGMLYLCFAFYASCRLWNAIAKRPLIVAEYADKFAQHGIYMEYRKLQKFHWSRGPYGCHFVYLFPRTAVLS